MDKEAVAHGENSTAISALPRFESSGIGVIFTWDPKLTQVHRTASTALVAPFPSPTRRRVIVAVTCPFMHVLVAQRNQHGWAVLYAS